MADRAGRPGHRRSWFRRLSVAGLRPSDPRQDSPASRRLRRSALAGMGILALAAGLLGVQTPAPWAAETATVLAVQRTWPQLWALAAGQDAPLLLFYAVAKVWADLLGWLPPLVAVRSLSAAAAAGAVMVVFSLVARRLGVLPAILAAAVLVSLPGFTRWAQDARPYALLMLLAASAWLAWDTWPRPDEEPAPSLLARWGNRLRSGWAVVVLLGTSAMASLFAGFAWPAMLVADLVTPAATRTQRWRRLRQDSFLMSVTLVVFGLPLYVGITMGRGPTAGTSVSPGLVIDRLVQLAVVFPRPLLAVPIALLAGVGILVAFLPVRAVAALPQRLTAAAQMATAWMIVPLVASVTLGMARPTLFRARYLVPLLAPGSLLAVIGALAIGLVVASIVARAAQRPGHRPGVGVGLVSLVAVLIVIGQAALLVPSQRAVRGPEGHDVNTTAMTGYVDHLLAQAPNQPLVTEADVVHAYLNCVRPDLAAKEVAFTIVPDSSWVWPAAVPPQQLRERLSGEPRAVWVTPVNWVGNHAPTALPEAWAGTGLHIESAERQGSFWVMQLGRA